MASDKRRRSSSDHGHSHSHAHDHAGESEQLLKALSGAGGDPGSRITLIGLATNIGLVGAKGAAGWLLNSASLIADAGHSLSDLIGDFVVLFCWRWSRRPASSSFPHGYAKFEALGTLIVAGLLLLGGSGIGMHSYWLLRGHSDDDHHAVDPNAAWFALGGILIKEWLYRATMSVAKSEQSSVLKASALHHRSDALSSTVALAAIGASWFGLSMADPLGGLCVAAMILSQGLSVGLGSVRELLDQVDDPLLGVDVQNFVASQGLGGDTAIPAILDVPGPAKARRGALDLVVAVKPETTVLECGELEAELAKRVKLQFPVVTELRLRFRTIRPHS